MFWHKAWHDTRWRFIVGLVILMMVACGNVFEYPAVARLSATAPALDGGGATTRLLNEALQVQRTYRGFIWWQWFRQNLMQIGMLLAVLLGSGGVLTAASTGTLFTLSLPVSRSRALGIRAATGLLEWLALVAVPSFVIPLLSPAIGQRYGIADVLAFGVCVFTGGSVFFAAAFLLSTVFGDLWRPLLITCAVAIALSVWEFAYPTLSLGIFRVMRGEAYFRGEGLPWLGLLAAAVVAAALIYAAIQNIARRDF